MTLDDTLRDGSSFGKRCTSLIAHLPVKFMLNSSFSLILVILQAYRLILKSIIVLHLVFNELAAQVSISTHVLCCKQRPRDWQLIQIFLLMNKNSQHFSCCSLVLAYSFRSWLQSTLPSIQFWPSWPLELLMKVNKWN